MCFLIISSPSYLQQVQKLMSQIMTAVKMKIYTQVAKTAYSILPTKYLLIKLLSKSLEEIQKFL